MPDAPMLLGRRLAGKYVLEAHVGGGAMGEVYRARHLALGTALAIKIMREDIARDPSFRERFFREAKATSMLEHPNSVRVVDFGEEPDGLVYLAMEFLDGRDLLTVLRQDWPLPDARIVDLLAQALSAVSVAHGRGIVHRDLKPENIMVLAMPDDDGPRDLVKVCDFGIAKLTDPRAFKTDGDGKPLTSSGAVVGTPEYMSPEQARGDALDARSDIYSLGIILYQMLTGRVPFTAENALGVVLKQVIDIPKAPSELRPGVNPRLEAICLRAIAKAPDHRYATAREMRAELRAALGSTGSDSRPRLDSDPNLALLPTSRPGAFGNTAAQSGALPVSAPHPGSSPDFGRKASVGGAEVAIRPAKPSPVALVAVGLGVLFLAVGGGWAALRHRETTGSGVLPVTRGTASSPLRELDLGGDGTPAFVPPLPTASASVATPSLGPAAGPAAGSVAPAGSGRASVAASAMVAASAAPRASASAVASAKPAASSAAIADPVPVAEYNPRGAFVGVLHAQATHVRPEAVTAVVRSQNARLTACYQDTLRAVGAPLGGRYELSMNIDERGVITFVHVNVPAKLGGFVRCARDTLQGKSVGPVEASASASQFLDLHAD